jgi:hypothetical protein
MMKSVRSVALVAVGAFALSACGLGALIPDQTVNGGVLGLGGGVEVELSAAPVTPSVVQVFATTWVGTIDKTFTLAGIDLNVPVNPAAITETIVLGNTIVVRNPDAGTGPFTVTGLLIGGSFTVGGQVFPVPPGVGAANLSVLFDNSICAEDGEDWVCTYTTAQNVPSIDLEFLSNQVQAYWNMLKGLGGDVSVNLTVTVTLANPGLPAGATVTVTLASAGATIEF